MNLWKSSCHPDRTGEPYYSNDSKCPWKAWRFYFKSHICTGWLTCVKGLWRLFWQP